MTNKAESTLIYNEKEIEFERFKSIKITRIQYGTSY